MELEKCNMKHSMNEVLEDLLTIPNNIVISIGPVAFLDIL